MYVLSISYHSISIRRHLYGRCGVYLKRAHTTATDEADIWYLNHLCCFCYFSNGTNCKFFTINVH